MKRRLLITALIFLLAGSNAFSAWDPTKPGNDDIVKYGPAVIRANFEAIAIGTDSALLITNAKISPTAGIVDTKLAQIITANKVSATALCNFSSAPTGAGVWPLANLPGINDFLPSQTANSGKSLITNGGAASWGFPTGLNITSQAQGDILFYNGSAWVRFAPGTSGYVLKTLGAGQTPTWTDTAPKAADLTITSQAAGDILYFDGSNWVRLAKDIGKYLKSGDNVVSWQPVIGFSEVAGDTLVTSADTERSGTNNYPSSYTKVKEFTVDQPGIYRISFDLKTWGDGSAYAYGQIFKNGNPIGTERSTNSHSNIEGQGYVTYSEDISGWVAGDKIQLYIKTNDGYYPMTRYFRIYKSNGGYISYDANP
ncbi:MAG: hypothetical protein ABSB18_06420 [Candidatus Omnitrophota bacterium]